VIEFNGDRDKSYPVEYELPPGATLWTRWDLAEWAKRARNAKPLPAGETLWIEATWDAARERDVWNGSAITHFTMRLP